MCKINFSVIAKECSRSCAVEVDITCVIRTFDMQFNKCTNLTN